jgi:hypothetical protein
MSDRAQSNFENAQKSTGPKTPEGRAAVAQNRAIHCLTGAQIKLPTEDPEPYNLLRAALFDEHCPQGPTETFLVETIVHNQHRLTRIAEMETAILADLAGLPIEQTTPITLAALEMVRRAGDPLKAHTLLQRYENSCRRAYNTALTQLRVTQNNRKRENKERQKFFEEAKARFKDECYEVLAMKPSRPSPQPVENLNCDSNPNTPAAVPENDPNGA